MKKLLIISSFTILFTSIYFSCKDEFLDRQPLNESSDIGFYRNASDALAALNSVYDVMQWNFLWKFEIGVIGSRFNNDVGQLPRPDFSTGFLPTNERRLGHWAQLYTGINRANIVLDRVSEIDMDAQLKDRILAEAKFCRGLFYFVLSHMWGDVPLRTQPTTLDNLALAKSPRADIVAQVISDLQDAEQSLPLRSQQAAEDLGRATKGSATALLGKVYLYDENWSQAAAKFQEVINSGEYQLNEDYMPQFLLGGDNSPESVFEVQFQTGGPGWNTGSDGSWMSGWNGVTGHGDAITFGFGAGFQPNEEFVSSFEEGDERLEYIVRDGDDYFGIPFVAANSPTGFGLRKYIVPKTAEVGSGNSPINHHVIRYADVLLMYAEALNENGSGPTPEAYDAINQVRTRAKLPALPTGLSQSEFFDALVQERRLELFLEHHRTWDLIRWGLAGDVLTTTNEYQEGKNRFLPIPQSELNANPDLVQNPSYE